MAYKVRVTRSTGTDGKPTGGYDLSYGKGSKKVTASLDTLSNGMWAVTMGGEKGGEHKLKRDAVAEWEEWVIKNYGLEDGGQVETEVSDTSTGNADEPPASDPMGNTHESAIRTREFGDLPLSFPAPVVTTGPRHVYYPQQPTQLFPYERGFAIYDNETRTQVGWCLREEQAKESVEQHGTESLVVK